MTSGRYSDDPPARPGWRPPPPALDAVRALRDRLGAARAQAAELEPLRARLVELEMRALEGAAYAAPDGADVGPELAARLGRALRRLAACGEAQDTLERGAEARGTRSPARRLARLRSGRDALRLWLDAPLRDSPSQAVTIIRGSLMAACLGVLAAAWWVHPVFLIMLLPLAGASTFLSGTGQDRAFRRKGAERQFASAGLDPPPGWSEPAVQAALAAVEDALRREFRSLLDPTPVEAPSDEEIATATLERVGAEQRVASLASEAGLSLASLDGEVGAWLMRASEASDARTERAALEADIAARKREIGDVREEVHRLLVRHHHAPDSASQDALEPALDTYIAELEHGACA